MTTAVCDVAKEVSSLLHPSKLRVSGKFSTILACLCGETWTKPAMAELIVLSDGGFLARMENDIGFNDFLGQESDLWRNVHGVMDACEFDEEQREWLIGRVVAIGGHLR